jgi:hypothetical protein
MGMTINENGLLIGKITGHFRFLMASPGMDKSSIKAIMMGTGILFL